MLFGRIVLWLAIIAFALGGLAYLVEPAGFAEAAGISFAGAGATDFRATYVGLPFGLAAFMVWCVLRPSRYPAGLLMLAFVTSGVALIRLLGLAVDGNVLPFNLMALGLEVPGALLASIAFAKCRRLEPAGSVEAKPPPRVF